MFYTTSFEKLCPAITEEKDTPKAKLAASNESILFPILLKSDNIKYSYDIMKSKGGIPVLSIKNINKIGSLVLLLIALFAIYGLFTNTMVSTIGGILIATLCFGSSIVFWLYSATEESGC